MSESIESKEKKSWYDSSYKILLIIPVALMLICLGYLLFFHSQHNDFIYKDVSLSGGTSITIQGDVPASLESEIKAKYPDLVVRRLADMTTGKNIASIFESSAESAEFKSALESALGYKLTDENSSIEFSGPTMSDSFYKQLLIALVISFMLMSMVIFILFRTFVPSIAVIFAAFSDIVMPLALINLLGIQLSAAGIAAFLMLIGYSVDTDILLTTRALKKRDGTLNERIYGAFKTGSFMTITALFAVLPAFFLITGLPDSFRQIFLILALGLFADLINTWLTNASIIKWYCERKGIK